jgi:integrase
MKKTHEALVSYLNREEIQALLDAPDTSTASGLRDRAMLHVAYACGLRVAELVSLRLDQLDSRNPASIHVIGKGRREPHNEYTRWPSSRLVDSSLSPSFFRTTALRNPLDDEDLEAFNYLRFHTPFSAAMRETFVTLHK